MKHAYLTVGAIFVTFILFIGVIAILDNYEVTNTGLFTLPTKVTPVKINNTTIKDIPKVTTQSNLTKNLTRSSLTLTPFSLANLQIQKSALDNLYCQAAKKKMEASNKALACYKNSLPNDPLISGNVYVYYKLKCPTCQFQEFEGCYIDRDSCKSELSDYELEKSCKLDYLDQNTLYQKWANTVPQNYRQSNNGFSYEVSGIDNQNDSPTSSKYYMELLIAKDVVGSQSNFCSTFKANTKCKLGQCIDPTIKKEFDLYVGKIDEIVQSKECVNSVKFQICNKGKNTIEDNFDINVTANGFSHQFTFDVQANEKLLSNKCITYENPIHLNIMKYALNLDTNANVNIVLDNTNKILEKDESNNSKSQTVYTGKEYMYDTTTKCDVWCYDSDAGEGFNGLGYDVEGKIAFKFNDLMHINEDNCAWDNDKILFEELCKPPVLMDNGMFSNPEDTQAIDCSIIGQLMGGKSGMCLDNKCIPLDKDYSTCNDHDNQCVGLSEYECQKYTEYSTSNNSEKKIQQDVCLDNSGNPLPYDSTEFSTVVLDYSCSTLPYVFGPNGQPISYPNSNTYDCTNDDKVCSHGKCVKPEESKITCTDSDDLNYFKAGFGKSESSVTIYGKTYTESTKQFDQCSNYGATLGEVFCNDENKLDWQWVSCFDMGKGCINTYDEALDIYAAKCVDPDESKLRCTDDDGGLNWETSGHINSVNLFGEEQDQWDQCIDENTLIEYFCEGKINKQQNYTCPTGTKCYNGACKQTIDPSQVYCNDFDGGKLPNIAGITQVKDIFGNEYWNQDYCRNETKIKEVFCDGIILSYEDITCETGKFCHDNLILEYNNQQYKSARCETGDLTKKQCIDSDGSSLDVFGTVTTTNVFGETDTFNDWCISDTEVYEQYCDGKERRQDIKLCPTGYKCNWNENKCMPATSEKKCNDLDLNNLNPDEIASGVELTDNFGNKNISVDSCYWGNPKSLSEAICSNAESTYNTIDCTAKGMGCGFETITYNNENYTSAKCMLPDENLKTCEDNDDSNIFTPGIVNTIDEFDRSHWFEDSCINNNMIKENTCSGTSQLENEYSCPTGYVCKDNIIMPGIDLDDGGAACVKEVSTVENICIDSDNGKNTNLAGATIIVNSYNQFITGEPDQCHNNQVEEVFCNGNDLGYEMISCPEGTTCKTGEFTFTQFGFSDKAALCVPN